MEMVGVEADVSGGEVASKSTVNRIRIYVANIYLGINWDYEVANRQISDLFRNGDSSL